MRVCALEAVVVVGLVGAGAGCGKSSSSREDAGEPPLGEVGAECATNEECESGICLEIGRCSRPCEAVADCPQFENWSCEEVADLGEICWCGSLTPDFCSRDPLDRDCNAQHTDEDDCPRPSQPLVSYDDLDILFVIDNSGSMHEEQVSLTANFNRFMNVLENLPGGLPSIHIGVISTDVGAGPLDTSGCTGEGDNGTLQNAPRSACSPPDDRYIIDLDDGAGGRIRNYSGTLAETFSCIAQLGTSGCGFEQTLESMRRALDGSNELNAGFLRDEAVLAIVILSDEDDCSAANEFVFSLSQNSLEEPLGPFASYRCFEFGVVCDPDEPRTVGPKQGCLPRHDSEYMYRLDHYAGFLRGIKDDPYRLVVAGIFGNPTPVNVTFDSEFMRFDLEPSCWSSQFGDAAPGIRLKYFVDRFPLSTYTTICNQDLSDALSLVGQLFGNAISGYCLSFDPYDFDPAEGLQHDCSVTDVSDYGTASETVVQEIPECTATEPPAPIPCWHWAGTCADGSRPKVAVERSVEPAEGITTVVSCTVAGQDCTPSCSGRECGSDGCGSTCPPGCSGAEACNEATGQCEVISWPDAGAGTGSPPDAGVPDAYAGPHWAPMTSNTSEVLYGIWGASSTDVFAVGAAGTILHYTGSDWAPMSSGTSETLNGVWGVSGSEVFAVGTSGTILRYNGSDWSPMTSGTSSELWSVWGASGSNVFAVGLTYGPGGTIARYDGDSWSATSAPVTGGLLGVWGSSATDVYAVGWNDVTDGAALNYDGFDWSPVAIKPTSLVFAVWGASSTDVFAVGYPVIGSQGTIAHYDGDTWATMPTGTYAEYVSVWGASGSDVFAVGGGGSILYYDGGAWSPMASGTSENLWGVWGTGSTDVFAVGAAGTILHYE